jgi:hypothetical protein
MKPRDKELVQSCGKKTTPLLVPKEKTVDCLVSLALNQDGGEQKVVYQEDM